MSLDHEKSHLVPSSTSNQLNSAGDVAVASKRALIACHAGTTTSITQNILRSRSFTFITVNSLSELKTVAPIIIDGMDLAIVSMDLPSTKREETRLVYSESGLAALEFINANAYIPIILIDKTVTKDRVETFQGRACKIITDDGGLSSNLQSAVDSISESSQCSEIELDVCREALMNDAVRVCHRLSPHLPVLALYLGVPLSAIVDSVRYVLHRRDSLDSEFNNVFLETLSHDLTVSKEILESLQALLDANLPPPSAVAEILFEIPTGDHSEFAPVPNIGSEGVAISHRDADPVFNHLMQKIRFHFPTLAFHEGLKNRIIIELLQRAHYKTPYHDPQFNAILIQELSVEPTLAEETRSKIMSFYGKCAACETDIHLHYDQFTALEIEEKFCCLTSVQVQSPAECTDELKRMVLYSGDLAQADLPSKIEALLNQGADPMATFGERGPSILSKAVSLGNIRVVEVILSHVSHINQQDSHGRTALMYAVISERREMVRFLLEALAARKKVGELPVQLNLEACTTTGNTVLMKSVIRGHKNEVRLLIKHGADPNAKNPVNGWTPLMYAAENGDDQMFILLIELGANPNLASQLLRKPKSKTRIERTPLDILARKIKRMEAAEKHDEQHLLVLQNLLRNIKDKPPAAINHQSTSACHDPSG